MVNGGASDWQLDCAEIKQRGTHLLQSGLWSDCSFRVRDEIVKAHRLLLAMASPVFAAMLYGDLHESSSEPILVVDVSPEAFKALLEYMYSDKLEICSFDAAYDVYCAAQKYILPHLVNMCSTYMASHLSPENACRTYELASLFDDSTLMDRCLQVISSNTTQVLEDSSFMNIQQNTLLKVFTLNNLAIDSELELVNAAARYKETWEQATQSDSTSQDKVPVPESASSNTTRTAHDTRDGVIIRDVLKHIRFLTLTPQQFSDCASVTSLLTDSERSAVLMNISSSSPSLSMPDGFSISRQPRNSTSIDESSAGAVYCTREYTPSPGTSHTGTDTHWVVCGVSVTVDQPVSLLGVKVASQVLITSGGSDTYQEDIGVVLDDENGMIAHTGLNAAVKYNDLIDIKFDTPVALQVGKGYGIQIICNSLGHYPRGECSMTASGRDGDGAEVTLRIINVKFADDILRSFIIQKPITGAQR